MEALFENTYICDKKMMREFYRKYAVGPTPIISIVTAVLTPHDVAVRLVGRCLVVVHVVHHIQKRIPQIK